MYRQDEKDIDLKNDDTGVETPRTNIKKEDVKKNISDIDCVSKVVEDLQEEDTRKLNKELEEFAMERDHEGELAAKDIKSRLVFDGPELIGIETISGKVISKQYAIERSNKIKKSLAVSNHIYVHGSASFARRIINKIKGHSYNPSYATLFQYFDINFKLPLIEKIEQWFLSKQDSKIFGKWAKKYRQKKYNESLKQTRDVMTNKEHLEKFPLTGAIIEDQIKVDRIDVLPDGFEYPAKKFENNAQNSVDGLDDGEKLS
jgi:hypothetical protein